MNENELKIREKYEKQGWKVLRGGAPDFLCLKIENGKIIDALFIEVKFGRDNLSYEQAVYKKAVKFLKAKYKLEYLSNQLKPIQATPNFLTKPFLTKPDQTRPDRARPNFPTPDRPPQSIPAQPIIFEGDLNETKT